jgi:hypothetical protein
VNVFSRSPFFTNGVACADIAMFDFVQNNKIAIQVILGAVALTFVGFGVGSYTSAVEDPTWSRWARPRFTSVIWTGCWKVSLQMLPLASRHWMI